MSNPVTLITGASQGIGRELATSFARAGHSLILAARDEGNLDETKRTSLAFGIEVKVVVTDVTDPMQVDRMARKAIEHFGHVDNVINNSGIGGPSGPMWEIAVEDWRQTFAVNVEGVFLVSRAVLPAMVDRGSGSIVNIGSITGKRPLWGRSPYAASKSALIGLTRTLAVEAGPFGVRVNLISPGFVEGPRLDWVIRSQAEGRGIDPDVVRGEFAEEAALNRLTQPLDIARAALFLTSEGASGITGADVNVNSGAVMY